MFSDLKNSDIGKPKEAQYRTAILNCFKKVYHEISDKPKMNFAIDSHQTRLEGHDGFTKEKFGEELQLTESI